jgi:ABC-type thiamine transport system ATPase subunit
MPPATPPTPLLGQRRYVAIQDARSPHHHHLRVDFSVLKSVRFVLIGPSDCEKSTLLNVIGGYLRPTRYGPQTGKC